MYVESSYSTYFLSIDFTITMNVLKMKQVGALSQPMFDIKGMPKEKASG
jgi:hypothetical protein